MRASMVGKKRLPLILFSFYTNGMGYCMRLLKRSKNQYRCLLSNFTNFSSRLRYGRFYTQIIAQDSTVINF